jgi:hypothetical protein
MGGFLLGSYKSDPHHVYRDISYSGDPLARASGVS